MSKSDELYFQHMLEMAQKAVEKVNGLSHADFVEDENLRLALTHLVQIIGEAAAQVSPESRAAYPEIAWREAIGMRNRIVHDYLGVDEDVVWAVVQQDIPTLILPLERIVSDDAQAGGSG